MARIDTENEDVKKEIEKNKDELIKEIYTQDRNEMCTNPSAELLFYKKNINFTIFLNELKNGNFITAYNINKKDCEEMKKEQNKTIKK